MFDSCLVTNPDWTVYIYINSDMSSPTGAAGKHMPATFFYSLILIWRARVAQWWEHSPPPMWPGFKSRHGRHMWVEFVVCSLPWSKRFFSGYSGFPLSLKTNISKFQFDQGSGRQRTTMWMCYLQIVIYLFLLLRNVFLTTLCMYIGNIWEPPRLNKASFLF